ncbi:MAG: M23 family metallopeptidase [Chitinivibrionales bacterium]|nr:M23 family metallopeptidase [Chitinivibrionales bacterium]
MKRLVYPCLFGMVFYLSGFAQETAGPTFTDSTKDTALSADEQEDEFQGSLNAFFDNEKTALDSFAWDTKKINSGHLDLSRLTDTAKIPLVDSARQKYYSAPFENVITSDFGARGWLWHYGVDIRLSRGDTVRAAFDGVVRVREYDRHGYGVVIVVRHAGGLETIYGHLSRTWLTPNQTVRAGDMIGLGGSTGHSTGSHLHFETRYLGEPFDPHCLIDFGTFTLKSDTLVLTRDNFTYLAELRKVKWHIVRKGDTLKRLARNYHTTVAMICALNHISHTTKLRIGGRLAIGSTVPSDGKLTMRQLKSRPSI